MRRRGERHGLSLRPRPDSLPNLRLNAGKAVGIGNLAREQFDKRGLQETVYRYLEERRELLDRIQARRAGA